MGIEVVVEGLGKSFGPQVIWQDVTLTLPAGEISVMLGPSGTGKTVFLKSLIGLLKPEQGRVMIDGVDMVNDREHKVYEARKRVGLMFQDGALFGSLNLYDNTAFPLREHTRMNEKEVRRVVTEKLELVGLAGDEKKLPGEISGGMRKRAGLARALVMDPEIILCDEPDSGLDPVRTAYLTQLLLDLNARIDATMMVVTHNIEIASTLPDNIGMLYRRDLVMFGPREVLLTSEVPAVKQFLRGAQEGPIGMSEEKDSATLAREAADGSRNGVATLALGIPRQLRPSPGLPPRSAADRHRERVEQMLPDLSPAARMAILENHADEEAAAPASLADPGYPAEPGFPPERNFPAGPGYQGDPGYQAKPGPAEPGYPVQPGYPVGPVMPGPAYPAGPAASGPGYPASPAAASPVPPSAGVIATPEPARRRKKQKARDAYDVPELPGIAALRQTGQMFALGVSVMAMMFKRPFQFREFIQQFWFVASVTILPAALVSIPFGAVIALQLGSLAKQLGAESFIGGASVLAVIQQASPLIVALLIAGAGGSAICADLGARTIRDEMAAMEVMGVSPIQRLIVPRVLAAVCVAVALNGLVSVVGVVGGYFFNVIMQGGTPGAYLSSFSALAQLPDLYISEFKALIFGYIAAVVAAYRGLNPAGGPKGVGDAVNQAVVITFLLLFFVNLVLTAIYLQVVPPKGE